MQTISHAMAIIAVYGLAWYGLRTGGWIAKKVNERWHIV